MDYTFECGSCHAIYKLDDNQITPKGVKITCPKCMNYFILKKGIDKNVTIETAYVEYVVQDGPQDISKKTLVRPPEKPVYTERTDKKTIPIASLRPSAKPLHDQSFTVQEVTYPVLKEKKSKLTPYIFLFIVIVFILWILYWKVL